MNKLLERQINKYIEDKKSLPESIMRLFSVISESYDHFERDRKMLERSIELSSAEMIELNEQVRKETVENQKQVFVQIKESLNLLNEKDEKIIPDDIDFAKLAHIAEILKNETSKRRVAEKENIQRAVHLEASQRIAHIGSWELDLSNQDNLGANLLYWSDETYRIFGYEPGSVQVTNELFFNRVHPNDIEIIQNAIKRAIDNDEPYDIEHRIILENGIEKVVHERSEILKDPKSGKIMKMMGTVQDITERKKADRELRRVNYELKTLFENMLECAFTVDMTKYQLTQISPSCMEVYGYSVEEFLTKNNLWIDVVLEEDKTSIWAKHPALERGQSVVNTFRIHHGNGSIRWLESHLKPTLNKEGKLVRLDGVTMDITQKLEAQQALKDSELKFRYLIENAIDGILVGDGTGTISFASDSVQNITGFEPAEIIGNTTYESIHPADIYHIRNIVLQKVLNNPGHTEIVKYRRKKKDGTYIWVESSVTNLLNEPSVKGIVANFRDITERIEAEQALKNSEYKFRTLIEYSSDATVVIDENFKITFASDSILRVTGFLPEEVLGRENAETVYWEDRKIADDFLKKVMSNPGKPKSIIYRVKNKEGDIIWTERVAINLIHDPVINGIVINFRDVTEQHEYEEALKTSNEELRKSNTELDRFVYSVSHDLRAPLASMLGIISLMEFDVHVTSAKEDLILLKSSIIKLDNFITEILDYSRNSRLEIEKELINFTQLLHNITSDLKYMGPSNVAITLEISDNGHFFSDKRRLNIILNNLISNAIRYHDPLKDPYVKVKVVAGDDKAIIEVIDNGLGIKREHFQKVFEMFYRVSKRSEGSGLGLYIVKETVDKLNGNIEIDSELNIGSKFIITLPNLNIKRTHSIPDVQKSNSN